MGLAYRWYVQPTPVRKLAGEDDDDDERFRKWVAQKPRGYVLNTDSRLIRTGQHPASPINCVHR